LMNWRCPETGNSSGKRISSLRPVLEAGTG